MKYFYLFFVSISLFSLSDCGQEIFERRPMDPTFFSRSKRNASVSPFFLSSTIPNINPKWSATWTDKLKRDLLLNYDKFARPSERETKTKVTMDLKLIHIELDEARSIMTVHAWSTFRWTDDKLKWNKSEYGDIDILHLADHEIWQPDLLAYNSATGSSIDHYGNTNCIVKSSGNVLWVPPSIFHVFCELNLKMWPFDTQECSIVIGSWTYNGNEIDLNSENAGVTIETYLLNGEWEIIKTNKTRRVTKYSCCTEPYPDLLFEITIQRRSPIYKAIIITPITVIIIMTLATFCLPPKSGDKIVLGGATAFIICLFLLYFIQKVSAMANGSPLIVSFYSATLYLVAFSIVLSVIVINLSKSPKTTPLPWFIKNHLSGWLGRWLCINYTLFQGSSSKHPLRSSSRGEEMTDSQPVMTDQDGQDGSLLEESQNSSIQGDWISLAIAIDRISFIIYLFIFICFAIAYNV